MKKEIKLDSNRARFYMYSFGFHPNNHWILNYMPASTCNFYWACFLAVMISIINIPALLINWLNRNKDEYHEPFETFPSILMSLIFYGIWTDNYISLLEDKITGVELFFKSFLYSSVIGCFLILMVFFVIWFIGSIVIPIFDILDKWLTNKKKNDNGRKSCKKISWK